MQNNRLYNKEKVLHEVQNVESNKRGPIAGFEYAVQPDGTILAEQRWKLRQLSLKSFGFVAENPVAGSSSSDNGLYQHLPATSLSGIETAVDTSAKRFRQLPMLPFEPAPKPSIATSSLLRPSLSVTSSALSKAEKPDTSPEYAECLPFLSPSRRVRNRHNAVFGQHLPNALNSPGCALKVFGSQALKNEERSRCQDVALQSAIIPSNARRSFSSPTVNRNIDDTTNMQVDDDYDTLLANIDVDQLVFQRQSTDKRSSYDSRMSMQQESHSNLDTSTDSSRRWSSASTFPPIELANPVDISSDNTFDYALYGDETPQSRNSNSATFFGNGGNMTTSRHSSHSTPGETIPSCSSGQGSYFPDSSLVNTDSGAPYCPGHNLPCRVLISRSANNPGREFYKCCMPEGQACDFFQWADGLEGNRMDTLSGHEEGVAFPGNVKDMYTENSRKFGHRSFRPGQKDVIEQALNGRDVFVLMPTGGGKSLCYQLPAWCCPGLAVVISPLLSLVQDQVQSLTKLGIQSVFLNSTQDYQSEQVDITHRLKETTAHGGVKLLYLTPEKLRHSNLLQSILKRLYNKNLISRFVIDEAHCLSDWGHDFRPDYNNLSILRQQFPNVPLMALTATANEKVVEDAIRSLGMRNEYRYRSSFNRPNLHYEVRKKDGKLLDEIADYIANKPRDSGVIYCLSRKDCEQVAEKLQEKLRGKCCGNIRVSFYHAELDSDERARRHHAWSNGTISVLCATVAFGMGIDKPGKAECAVVCSLFWVYSEFVILFFIDVRYVIHYSMPKSITH